MLKQKGIEETLKEKKYFAKAARKLVSFARGQKEANGLPPQGLPRYIFPLTVDGAPGARTIVFLSNTTMWRSWVGGNEHSDVRLNLQLLVSSELRPLAVMHPPLDTEIVLPPKKAWPLCPKMKSVAP
jgi:hypothetical protein